VSVSSNRGLEKEEREGEEHRSTSFLQERRRRDGGKSMKRLFGRKGDAVGMSPRGRDLGNKVKKVVRGGGEVKVFYWCGVREAGAGLGQRSQVRLMRVKRYYTRKGPKGGVMFSEGRQ